MAPAQLVNSVPILLLLLVIIVVVFLQVVLLQATPVTQHVQAVGPSYLEALVLAQVVHLYQLLAVLAAVILYLVGWSILEIISRSAVLEIVQLEKSA